METQDRLVGHAILDGYIEVYARAYSIPEALALESALKSVPIAEAYQPEPKQEAPELTPEIAALAERSEDSDMGLKAGEAG